MQFLEVTYIWMGRWRGTGWMDGWGTTIYGCARGRRGFLRTGGERWVIARKGWRNDVRVDKVAGK